MHRIHRAAALALLFAPTAAALAAPGVGLSAVRSHRLENATSGGTGPQLDDRFAETIATGDLDGDGFDDLVIGIPADDGPLAAPISDGGSVSVYFGADGSGVSDASPLRLSQPLPEAEPGDRHGQTLAVCDFDGDGIDDLAVGAGGEDVGGIEFAGAVFVYPGFASGPDPQVFLRLTQDTPGVPDSAEDIDSFGSALACGDFDDDGFDDLAIGASAEDVGSATDAGWVAVIPGSPSGLAPAGTRAFTQEGPDILDDPENFDLFGSAIAAGDLDGDGFDDLAIGVPGENSFCGMVHVLFGGSTGVDGIGSLVLTDAVLGGLFEFGDAFGLALTFGDFDSDGFDDLAIGIPFETFAAPGGPVGQTGTVVVLSGSTALPGPANASYWAENNIHFAGASEANDRFGSALAVGDFNGDGYDDLASGHPGETIDFAGDGAVTALAGSPAGLSPTAGRGLFVAGRQGLPGPLPSSVPGRELGWALAAGDFDGDGFADLAIGTPGDRSGGVTRAGTATVLHGALFADGFESDLPFDPWAVSP